ncbi:MAG: CmcI family methyltransferase [Candidatus Parabeggiatoa sp.]|nr:CmcI family methyltransferase [Candidatus Parabeggiatoa sp.]
MIEIDLKKGLIRQREDNETKTYHLGSPEAFALISQIWLRAGWYSKQVYTFSWLGRPIIQLPEDMIRIQEVIYKSKPDVIIETGVAHGGSLIFYASLCKLIGKGRVIGVDVEIRPHNRKAIEAHELFPYITLIEGSSIDTQIVNQVKSLVKTNETVLIMLDSNHTKEHVLGELNAYAELVSPASYIVVADGIMKDLVGSPRTHPDWAWNNPYEAAQAFLKNHPEFVLEQPQWPFNESNGLSENVVTYWPGAWLRRL